MGQHQPLGRAFAVQHVLQQVSGLIAFQADVLVDGGDAGVGEIGHVQAVVTHHGIIPGHLVAEALDRLDGADGKHVAHAQKGGDTAGVVGLEVAAHPVTGLFPQKIGVDDLVVGEGQAVALHRLMGAGQTLHAHHGLLAPVYQHDAPVALVDEVLGELVEGGDVVQRDVAHIRALHLGVDGDTGRAARGKTVAVGVGGLEAQQNRPAEVVLVAQLLIAFLALDLGVDHVHRELHAPFLGELVTALHQHGLEVVEHLIFQKAGDDQRDAAGVFAGEAAGDQVRVVSHLPRRADDPLAGVLVHIGVVVQRAGDSAHRHTGSFCHILNGH